jgi:L-2-hydroxyglutarate oxidase LhgO
VEYKFILKLKVGQNVKLIADENGDLHQMKFALVINCAGAWAGEVAKMAGIGTGEGVMSIPLPVEFYWWRKPQVTQRKPPTCCKSLTNFII